MLLSAEVKEAIKTGISNRHKLVMAKFNLGIKAINEPPAIPPIVKNMTSDKIENRGSVIIKAKSKPNMLA